VDTAQIFKAYDVRGTYPDQLNERMFRAIGSAFATFAGTERIVVARDMRPSGVTLCAAFAEGARAAGVRVTDLGLASTDFLYFASGHLNAPGAMLTASHNPAQYNGIKMCLAGAAPVGVESGLAAIERLTEQFLDAPASGPLVPLDERDLTRAWVEHVHGFVNRTTLRPLAVVADTANGMGGFVVPLVFAQLPFRLDVLFGELDGTFPNHPADPIQPENLVDLQARVLATGADVGLAFDGDADRVFLVDEKAQLVSGSVTTAMVAAALLRDHPGATILHNVICSKTVAEVVTEGGGVAVRTRVGHSFIKQVMAETGAVFGGEHSGHYYFRENYRADSGIVAALIVLGLLSEANVPLSEFARPFQRYADSGEINTLVSDPTYVVAQLAKRAEVAGASVDFLDGVTVDHGTWWYNVRPSNTEPLLRLNVEANTPGECEQHVDEVLTMIRELQGH
jgi:phosphomannomutase